MKDKILITCEHGGNSIPKWLADDIKIPQSYLSSHRGYDKGALDIALKLSKLLDTKPVVNTISRLIIDFNRSLTNKDLWSQYSKNLKTETKNKLLEEYNKYRQNVEERLRSYPYHLSIHSFTPVKNGVRRNCEFAILYDPSRLKEKNLAVTIKKELIAKSIKCRLNYPYRGISDGLTSYLRKKLGRKYRGLELEFNQSIIKDTQKVDVILATVIECIAKTKPKPLV